MRTKKPKENQPSIAVANKPFTPMSHRYGTEKDTPFRPLRAKDLMTPINNKTRSSMNSRFNDSPEISNFSDDADGENSFTALKGLLTKALLIVEKMECERKKKYKDVQIQTDDLEISNESDTEPTEISIQSDSSDSSVLLNNSSIKEKENEYEYSSDNDQFSIESFMCSSPVSMKSGKNRECRDKSLENLINDLSLELKKLEDQIEEMNQTNLN